MPMRRFSGASLSLALTLSALGGGSTALRSDAAPAASDSADDRIRRVLVISVDGLNPAALVRIGPEGVPGFTRLRREGASTYAARTAVERTTTLPDHTGMLTGRRVNRRLGGHGVWFHHDNDRTVHHAAGEYVASVFDVVHDRGRRTGIFTTKRKFTLFDRTWNARNGRPDRVGVNHGRDKIDRFTYRANSRTVVELLRNELRTRPRAFTFLHLADPDAAGHDHGFMSLAYYRAVRRVDTLIDDIRATIRNDDRLRRHTLLVVTSDHGGLPGARNHTDPARFHNYRIPFFVTGPGVPWRSDLYAMNPFYEAPGTGRPGYAGKQPIRNAVIANLVTDVLDLPVVPGSELNRRHGFNVFG